MIVTKLLEERGMRKRKEVDEEEKKTVLLKLRFFEKWCWSSLTFDADERIFEYWWRKFSLSDSCSIEKNYLSLLWKEVRIESERKMAINEKNKNMIFFPLPNTKMLIHDSWPKIECKHHLFLLAETIKISRSEFQQRKFHLNIYLYDLTHSSVHWVQIRRLSYGNYWFICGPKK